jgi:two-component system response regulator MprA/two-component system response regulator TrcR
MRRRSRLLRTALAADERCAITSVFDLYKRSRTLSILSGKSLTIALEAVGVSWVHDSMERRGTTGIGGEKMRPGTRVLLVEDDRLIAEFVEPELERLGFRVRCAYDGPSGLEEARIFEPELLVLDIMLPRLDGVGVLKELRSEGIRTPVIMLTARDATIDKVHSLDLGADDYVTKPFEMDELLARIRALLRRTEGDEILRVADLEVNTSTHEVRRKERKIDLTAREYALLEFMAHHPNRVLSRELLLSQVWDRGFGVTTNVVEVYIAYLRKKVDGPGEQRLIQTLRGSGYALKGA